MEQVYPFKELLLPIYGHKLFLHTVNAILSYVRCFVSITRQKNGFPMP